MDRPVDPTPPDQTKGWGEPARPPDVQPVARGAAARSAWAVHEDPASTGNSVVRGMLTLQQINAWIVGGVILAFEAIIGVGQVVPGAQGLVATVLIVATVAGALFLGLLGKRLIARLSGRHLRSVWTILIAVIVLLVPLALTNPV